MSLETQVLEIVAQQLGKPQNELSHAHSFIEDLEADSLDLTELVMALEEAFSLDISEEDAASLKTVGDAVSYIKEKKA